MSVHTLGDWHRSIIHGLCRAWYLILKALVQRVSRFWAGRPRSSAPACRTENFRWSLLLHKLFISPPSGEERLNSEATREESSVFSGERILERAGRSRSSSLPAPQPLPRAGSAALNNTLAFMEMYQMFQEPRLRFSYLTCSLCRI